MYPWRCFAKLSCRDAALRRGEIGDKIERSRQFLYRKNLPQRKVLAASRQDLHVLSPRALTTSALLAVRVLSPTRLPWRKEKADQACKGCMRSIRESHTS